ncbi:MAG TPA: sugar ABC transporter permease, partial [Anaerolineaceae bacterium]|nr:sugar ABC transporter permease [Anaerolineaceae bacterium]
MSVLAKPRKTLTLARQEIRDGLWLLAPSMLVILIITVLPVIFTLVL